MAINIMFPLCILQLLQLFVLEPYTANKTRHFGLNIIIRFRGHLRILFKSDEMLQISNRLLDFFNFS